MNENRYKINIKIFSLTMHMHQEVSAVQTHHISKGWIIEASMIEQKKSENTINFISYPSLWTAADCYTAEFAGRENPDSIRLAARYLLPIVLIYSNTQIY